jgi:hypothetical protein
MNNKYDFNAYDTIIALVLTQFLKERNYKAELRNVVETGTVDGAALADLLNRAVAWSKGGLNASSNRYTEEMKQAVTAALDDFSGVRYVQSMDVGFCQFLDDFYHDRIK